MNNENSIYYNIRMDLDSAQNLKQIVKEKPEWISGMFQMSENFFATFGMVADNWDDYISIWKKSLTLTEFKGTLIERGNDYYISMPVNTPESTVILLEAK